MPLTVTDVLLGLVVPAIGTFLVMKAAAWCLRRESLLHAVCPIAVTGGFLLGYWLLKLGPIVPQVDRDWVPYAAVLSLAAAIIPDRSRRTLLIRLLVLFLVVIAVAFVLVPTWSSLTPSRTVHLVAWSVGTYVLGAGLMLITRHSPGRLDSASCNRANLRWVWVATMIVAFAFASALLALSGSLRFAQTTSAAMAALIGLGGGLWAGKGRFSIDGVVLVYTVLICSALLTGKVNSFSNIPTISYCILPLAPLSCGLMQSNGTHRITVKRMALTVALAASVCGVALGLALAAEFGGDLQD